MVQREFGCLRIILPSIQEWLTVKGTVGLLCAGTDLGDDLDEGDTPPNA